ncbi:hypothetical protein D3C81_784600 [compost metagenome]
MSLHLKYAQLVAAQPAHGRQPVTHLDRLITTGDQQHFVNAVAGVLEQGLNTATQREQITPNHDQNGHTRLLFMLITHLSGHATRNSLHFGRHTHSLQMRPQHRCGMRLHCRVMHPVGIGVLALYQQFGDVLNHLQAMHLDQPPEQIVRRQAGELRIKTANGTHSVTFER